MDLKTDIADSNIGVFLKLWSALEQRLIKRSRKYIRDVQNLRTAAYVLAKYEIEKSVLYNKINYMRKFRNTVVHEPLYVSNEELNKNIQILKQIKNETL